ncbi:MAG: hypothetical protein JSV76_05705 [Candidatus Bathyarchaeota archaeon]|nr:MAG: hypothetical protein JSV76_05705 [Candidatus Bathyarchaeota archaeon]
MYDYKYVLQITQYYPHLRRHHMHIIYVGDSRNVYKRIRNNHCSGNVEASALRRYVAEALGFQIRRERRPIGSTRVRIDLPNPRQGEQAVTDYIRQGKWQILLLDHYDLAHDFQWYVIEKLNPFLNRECKNFQTQKSELYGNLIERLTKSSFINYRSLTKTSSKPGIYVLYHEQKPTN